MLTYDSKNRLLAASSGVNTMTVAYDYRNRPVSRTINGITTYLIHDGWNLIEELDDTGDLEVAYTHGPMIDELLAKIDTTGTVYYHHDGLGSTIALTDDTGDPVENYTYDVFGAVTILDPSTACGNRFLFTGREHRQSGDSGVDSAAAGPEGRDERERASQWLAEVALYDYRNRIYHSELGRFLQTDPIRFDAGDVNLYRYVANNPINWMDPEGLQQRDRGGPGAARKKCCEANGGRWVERRFCPSSRCAEPGVYGPPGMGAGGGALAGVATGARFGGPLGAIAGGLLGEAYCRSKMCCME